jgi:hypothetical protein
MLNSILKNKNFSFHFKLSNWKFARDLQNTQTQTKKLTKFKPKLKPLYVVFLGA